MGTTDELLEKFHEQARKLTDIAREEGQSEDQIEFATRILKRFYLFGAMDALVLGVNPGELLLTVVRECTMNETVDEEVEEVTDASDS